MDGARSDTKTRVRSKLLRVTRRVHLFLGLLLMPWLVFFGLSGVAFNHPNLGEPVEGRRMGSAELGMSAWKPDVAARELLAQLNAQGTERYVLDGDEAPALHGFTLLDAPAPDGRYLLLLDMQRTQGVLVTRHARASAASDHLSERTLQLPSLSLETLEKQAQGLLRKHGLPGERELTLHPKIAPELRLVVRDQAGVRWNLSYAVRTGRLTGRRTDAFPNLGITHVLSLLHTTHHFPFRVGALWFWALFQDLLGIAMAVWGFTGLLMWWQLKRTRVYGAVALALALSVAWLVMGETLSHVTFGDLRAPTGPGE